jgi:YHS domain-containing protein
MRISSAVWEKSAAPWLLTRVPCMQAPGVPNSGKFTLPQRQKPSNSCQLNPSDYIEVPFESTTVEGQEAMRTLFAVLCAGLMLGVLAGDAKKDPPKEAAPEPPKAPTQQDLEKMNADELEALGKCPVTKKDSKAVYHFEYKGKEYHFNTREAQKQFAADPSKYGAKGADAKK